MVGFVQSLLIWALAALSVAYALVAIVVYLLIVGSTIRSLRKPSMMAYLARQDPAFFGDLLIHLGLRNRRLWWLRISASTMLTTLATAICWPVLIPTARWAPRPAQLARNDQSGRALSMRSVSVGMFVPPVLVLPAFALLGLAAVVLWQAVDADDTWQIRWAALFGLVPLAVMAGTLVSFGSVPQALRKTPYPGYPAFLVAAALIAAVSSLSHGTVTAWTDGESGIVELVREFVVSLFTLQPLQDVTSYLADPSGEGLWAGSFYLAATGLLFYFTVAETILRRADLTRSQEDKNAIAANYIALGRYPKARNWLSSAPRNDLAAQALRACALIAEGRMDDGMSELDEAAKQSGLGDFPPAMLALGYAATFRFPGEAVRALARSLRASRVSSWGAVVLDHYALAASAEQARWSDIIEGAPLFELQSAVAALDPGAAEFAEVQREVLRKLSAVSFPEAADDCLRRVWLWQSRITPTSTRTEDGAVIAEWLRDQLPGIVDDIERALPHELIFIRNLLRAARLQFAVLSDEDLTALVNAEQACDTRLPVVIADLAQQMDEVVRL